MTFLPDVNVWLAIAVAEHEHHDSAAAWLESTTGHDIVFCRVTQMGLLRLLTNPQVMKTDVMTPAVAWKLFDRLCGESGATVAPEPEAAARLWRNFTIRASASPNGWTDAYICAFAEAKSFTAVTFDRGFSRHGATVRILT